MKLAALPYLEAEAFSRNGFILAVLFCFFVTISIGASQTCAVMLVIYWFCFIASGTSRLSWAPESRALLAPMFAWLAIGYLAAFIGINPPHALKEIGSTTTYTIMPLAIYATFAASPLSSSAVLFRISSFIGAFCGGQLVASIHTLASELVGHEIRPRPPGPLTESGQLVLIIPLIIALLVLSRRKDVVRRSSARPLILFAAASAIYVIACWPQLAVSPARQQQAAAGAVVALLILVVPPLARTFYLWARRPATLRLLYRQSLFNAAVLALLLGALVVNLKRGPWLGIIAAVCFLGGIASRRLAIYTLVGALAVAGFLAPVRQRINATAEHFFIEGGRQEMWQIGLELAQRFPLGLGPGNASFMRELDPTLPELHRHMHNNLINIAAETGWLGMAVFIWWMLALIRFGPRCWKAARRGGTRQQRQLASLALAMSAGIFGWQIAGLTEYNFGDGEVRMIALFYVGVMLAIGERVLAAERGPRKLPPGSRSGAT